jgi:hypothetical protein
MPNLSCDSSRKPSVAMLFTLLFHLWACDAPPVFTETVAPVTTANFF